VRFRPTISAVVRSGLLDDTSFCIFTCSSSEVGRCQVVVYNLAQAECLVRDEISGRHDLQYRQLANGASACDCRLSDPGPVHASFKSTSSKQYSTISQIRGAPSTWGMILSGKFGSRSEAIITAARLAVLCLYPIVAVAMRTGP
jgi:hypothetical protein